MDTQRKGRKLKFFFRDLVRETSTHPTVSRKSRFDTDGAFELGEALAARVGVWEFGQMCHRIRARDYGLPRERDSCRSLVSNAARCGQSCSVTAVNFNPSPLPSSICRTIASALICPSWTRKSSLAFIPTGRGLGVAINRPPALRSRTGETSSVPLQRQQTQTQSGVSTREVWRREKEGVCGEADTRHL